MKGAVICIEGEAPDTWSEDDEFSFRKQLTEFEAVQITTSKLIPFMFRRIWINMLTEGITDLVLAKAEFRDNGELELSGKGCRLPMIGMS